LESRVPWYAIFSVQHISRTSRLRFEHLWIRLWLLLIPFISWRTFHIEWCPTRYFISCQDVGDDFLFFRDVRELCFRDETVCPLTPELNWLIHYIIDVSDKVPMPQGYFPTRRSDGSAVNVVRHLGPVRRDGPIVSLTPRSNHLLPLSAHRTPILQPILMVISSYTKVSKWSISATSIDYDPCHPVLLISDGSR
jgi:hypothetical protein